MPTAVVPCPRPHDLATPAVQLLPVARTPLLTAAPRSATAPLALQALAAALLRPASPTAASQRLRRPNPTAASPECTGHAPTAFRPRRLTRSRSRRSPRPSSALLHCLASRRSSRLALARLCRCRRLPGLIRRGTPHSPHRCTRAPGAPPQHPTPASGVTLGPQTVGPTLENEYTHRRKWKFKKDKNKKN